MPRIFDNIEQQLLTAFSEILPLSSRAEGQLFSGAQNRLTIINSSNEPNGSNPFSTRYYRWDARNGERDALFDQIEYTQLSDFSLKFHGLYPKIGTASAVKFVGKILQDCSCNKFLIEFSKFPVYWVRVPGYFCQFFLSPPRAISENDGVLRVRGEVNEIYLVDDFTRRVFFATLNSSTYYQFFCAYTDGRHINTSDVKNFHFDYASMDIEVREKLFDLSYKLESSMQENTNACRKSGLGIDSVDSTQTKPIIDEIDRVLASHYGFTEEELDFIINYDIKYRMGLGTASADDDSGE